MAFKAHQDLPYLHGKPNARGDLRTENSDFKVFEMLPFMPSGDGEHVLLYVEKEGLNTGFVAKQLAKVFSVKDMQVTYAGLKDRNAVTQQWFGVHLPGKQGVDVSSINIEGVKVLQAARHNKKLKTGALIGNRFELILRNVSNPENVVSRFEQVAETGVPNYFGEQRFGHSANNLDRALALFAGQKVKDKKKRGLYLSAARSYLFNQNIAQRIEQSCFTTPILGDVFMLAGSQSIFTEFDDATEISSRLTSHDIDITASMWGAGELKSSGDAKVLELAIAEEQKALSEGLVNFGLKQERRRIRLNMSQAKSELIDESTVKLSFVLPAGSYATSILREVINYQDVSTLVN